MEEKERYINLSDRQVKDTQNNSQGFMSIKSICKTLNQQNARINELQEENQHLKDQVKKSYQEGLLQKQFDKDMEIQELKDKIEFLTTFKEVISEHKPAFCKLAGRDCEWLGKEKQLAIENCEFKKEKLYFDLLFTRLHYIHKQADEFREEKERYGIKDMALDSIWRVFDLQKHDCCEYEEMSELENGIKSIANDELLRDIEHDLQFKPTKTVDEIFEEIQKIDQQIKSLKGKN